MHDGFDIIPGEEAGCVVHHTLVPAIVVFLDYVDDGALLERQLIVFISGVVINGHHYKAKAALEKLYRQTCSNNEWKLKLD